MRFSIVIASYNRPARLRSCLEAVSRLSYPVSGFEAIVVDDGSPQPLQEAVASKPFESHFALRFFRQRNAGPARARNMGVENARGEWLVFLDDDCAPHRGWLEGFDEASRNNPDCLLGGRTRNACTDNLCAEVNQRLLDFVVDWFEDAGSPFRFFPSNNMAVPARAFREIGGFDQVFPMAGGEDREFCARWLASGREMRRAPHASIDHHHPQTLVQFLKMHYRYGRGAALLHERRRTSPMGSGGMHAGMVRMAASDGRLLSLGLFVLTQAAAAAGFLSARVGLKRSAG